MNATKNTYDLSPFLSQLIGADSLQNRLTNIRKNDGFPPHNIEVFPDERYQISLAIAGFSKDDITITQEENTIKIVGKLPEKEKDRKFLYKGIAERNFVRQFVLGEYIEVSSADMNNGILTIDLVKNVPDHKQPRVIPLGEKTTDKMQKKNE